MPRFCHGLCLPTLVMIAQVVFVLERRQTDKNRQTDATERPTHPAAIHPAYHADAVDNNT